jgi:hypothetical protein
MVAANARLATFGPASVEITPIAITGKFQHFAFPDGSRVRRAQKLRRAVSSKFLVSPDQNPDTARVVTGNAAKSPTAIRSDRTVIV